MSHSEGERDEIFLIKVGAGSQFDMNKNAQIYRFDSRPILNVYLKISACLVVNSLNESRVFMVLNKFFFYFRFELFQPKSNFGFYLVFPRLILPSPRILIGSW